MFKLKFRRKLKKGETLRSVFRETYDNTYRKTYKSLESSIKRTPDVIKNLPATSGTQIAALFSIGVLFGFVALATSNLGEIKDNIAQTEKNIQEVQSQLDERTSVYFSADGWKQADKSASEITEILNRIQQNTGDMEKEMTEAEALVPYLTYKASSDAVNWGSVYDKDYKWEYYVDKMSVDEDLIDIIFLLKAPKSSKPSRIITAKYSLILSQIIERQVMDIA